MNEVFGILLGGGAALLSRTYFTADALLIVLIGSDSTAVQNALDLSNTQISVDGLKAVQAEIQIIQTDDVLRAAVERVGVDAYRPWALATDRYELTMLQAALAAGTADRDCVFEVFTRRLPPGRRCRPPPAARCPTTARPRPWPRHRHRRRTPSRRP